MFCVVTARHTTPNQAPKWIMRNVIRVKDMQPTGEEALLLYLPNAVISLSE